MNQRHVSSVYRGALASASAFSNDQLLTTPEQYLDAPYYAATASSFVDSSSPPNSTIQDEAAQYIADHQHHHHSHDTPSDDPYHTGPEQYIFDNTDYKCLLGHSRAM
jgi:hypothetical protein